jgi:hypothetical protein
MSKVRWADMTDDDPEPEPVPSVIVTKHGVKISYVPPHLRPSPDKTKTPVNDKK